ncbi:Proteasome-interacting protein [Komagataella phaffii CBS 7435]|uniref:Uncharacterized protein n=2 Tax=Komagataella phaffii TaxID=460519 RepID=C4QZ44_KOMPG|nr:Hypothetical protein PAS_c121_0005 [Komagataella phaffii GS115]AOA60533.1 GQ67_01479T0 [Komagataella phaffii]CAH2447346.1 Proteasome-interacting protein [Komagataella phaffii CBS 7435]AOA66150.1 GQ68_01495T0 [Komagataella phaffii GS115]CAY68518.1 Hypothetical protein PAS_c121_0005 [Komagataella phaffii GS115]CCA37580.1 Proteasome-interacting protein [Komagataella phaffii CBS 7435]
MPPRKRITRSSAKSTSSPVGTPSKASPAKKGSKKSAVAKKNEVSTEETSIEQEDSKDDSLSVVENLAEGQKEFIKPAVIEKAVNELLAFLKKQDEEKSTKKSSLFEEDAVPFTLKFTSVKYFTDKVNLKPKLISLPHPLHRDEEEFKFCVFVNDKLIGEKELSQIENDEYLTKYVGRIVRGEELKGEFRPYDAREQLRESYDCFVSDDALVTTLPKLLGKTFYDSSVIHLPVPIKLRVFKGKDFSLDVLKQSLERVRTSTYYRVPFGTELEIRIGDSKMNPSDLLENITTVVNKVLSQEQTIIDVDLKSYDKSSAVLPIYTSDDFYTEDDVAEVALPPIRPVDVISKEDPLAAFKDALVEIAVDEDEAKKLISEVLVDSEKPKKRNHRHNHTDAQEPVSESLSNKKRKEE